MKTTDNATAAKRSTPFRSAASRPLPLRGPLPLTCRGWQRLLKGVLRLAAVACAIVISYTAAAQGMFRPQEEGSHPSPPTVPPYVVFCGDTIRFDTVERYERMDRELMTFTYMHTTSTLMLKRSLRCFSQVVPILMEHGVPEDFKYLMVIESNLEPKALSSAGAAGLWQFTKATARDFGLEVNSEVDERYHIAKETEAACRYLLRAWDRFHDWITVAASYNCGMPGVSRRIDEQKRSSAFDLWMPEETNRYIYRILAAKMLFENPAAFGFEVTERYPYIAPRQTVTISEPIPSLVEFAESHGVSYAELKRANLWLRDNKLTNKEKRTYSIAIPGR